MVVVGVHRQHDGDGDFTDFRDIKSSITSTGRRAGQFYHENCLQQFIFFFLRKESTSKFKFIHLRYNGEVRHASSIVLGRLTLYIVLIAPKTGARYQLELRRMNEQISAILLKAM
jgi:hypothetical protein